MAWTQSNHLTLQQFHHVHTFPVFGPITSLSVLLKPVLCHVLKRPFIWGAARQNQQNDVRPAKTLISLGIHPVWSESSLSTWRNLRSSAFSTAHSELWSDWVDAQTELSLHWAHKSFCWFWHASAHFLCLPFVKYDTIKSPTTALSKSKLLTFLLLTVSSIAFSLCCWIASLCSRRLCIAVILCSSLACSRCWFDSIFCRSSLL